MRARETSYSKNKKRRTKIVCTIGPSTSSQKMLERLVRAGMNCARLNFSHGKPEEHLQVIKSLREIGKRTGIEVAILQDLPGPKFRVGEIKNGSMNLKKNSTVTLTTRLLKGEENTIPLRAQNLPKYVGKGGEIFLSDGTIKLKIIQVTKDEIQCKCEIAGTLLSGKGVNVPELKQGFESFTHADREFLKFGLEHGIDLVAVSFVTTPKDVESVKNFVRKLRDDVSVFAKIEKRGAIPNIDGIVKVSDGLMVARGDLGVENPIEEVPELQKEIISKCNTQGIPVITATQMLESMVNNPSPTRAEVTDVANAIFDGTDAVMLSEETAVGKYPVECVYTLSKVALKAEEKMGSQKYPRSFPSSSNNNSMSLIDAVSSAASEISKEIHATAILLHFNNFQNVAKISRFRPEARILSISHSQDLVRRSRIIWGVESLTGTASESGAENLLRQSGFGAKDRIVIVGDEPSRANSREGMTIHAIELKGA